MLTNRRCSSAIGVFLEKEFLVERTNTSKIKLDEVRSVEEPTQSSKSIKSDLIRSNPKPIVETSIRRSGRVPHQLDVGAQSRLLSQTLGAAKLATNRSGDFWT